MFCLFSLLDSEKAPLNVQKPDKSNQVLRRVKAKLDDLKSWLVKQIVIMVSLATSSAVQEFWLSPFTLASWALENALGFNAQEEMENKAQYSVKTKIPKVIGGHFIGLA